MAKQKKTVEVVSATLATGTKVTASQAVIDKVNKQAQRDAAATASKSRSSK